MEKKAIIVAGPNGVGKTTFAKEYLKENIIPYISADAIAEQMSDGDIRDVALAAGKKFFLELNNTIESGKNFIVETTLSGLSFHRAIQKMKHASYNITIVYIYLETPEICIARIKERTRKGGHHVPDIDVTRRFNRSIANFWKKYKIESDRWYLICNSTQQFVDVAMGQKEEYSVVEERLYKLFLEVVGAQDER
ncbi:MAG: AAA family ATPase [Candidatus Krumholzibacteriota bacterium]|nr:AAA family ATPase [Candidatus Krumholzibacteriota bacterium]